MKRTVQMKNANLPGCGHSKAARSGKAKLGMPAGRIKKHKKRQPMFTLPVGMSIMLALLNRAGIDVHP